MDRFLIINVPKSILCLNFTPNVGNSIFYQNDVNVKTLKIDNFEVIII